MAEPLPPEAEAFVAGYRTGLTQRWTPETEQLAADALASSVCGYPVKAGPQAREHAKAVLRALSETGSLITPHASMVLDAVATYLMRKEEAPLAASERLAHDLQQRAGQQHTPEPG